MLFVIVIITKNIIVITVNIIIVIIIVILTVFEYPYTVIDCAVVVRIITTLDLLTNCKLERRWEILPLPHSLSLSMTVSVAL